MKIYIILGVQTPSLILWNRMGTFQISVGNFWPNDLGLSRHKFMQLQLFRQC